MISKERYADNVHNYVLKRKFFRKLIINNEMNKLAETFLEKIHDHILKIVKRFFLLISEIFRHLFIHI